MKLRWSQNSGIPGHAQNTSGRAHWRSVFMRSRHPSKASLLQARPKRSPRTADRTMLCAPGKGSTLKTSCLAKGSLLGGSSAEQGTSRGRVLLEHVGANSPQYSIHWPQTQALPQPHWGIVGKSLHLHFFYKMRWLEELLQRGKIGKYRAFLGVH